MTESVDGRFMPTLSAQDLLASVPGLDRLAEISVVESRMLPGPHLGVQDVISVLSILRDVAARGTDGVVITQGTDTIEEVAFALDLLLDVSLSVVVTGAMRPPGSPGADGPANLLSSVSLAASGLVRDIGVVVVLNDEIHAASQVRKSHTGSLSAFTSATGPIGWISEGRPCLLARPITQSTLPLPPGGRTPRVPILTAGLGDDGSAVRALLGNCDGLVVEGMGGGHVPPTMVAPLEVLAAAVPVILATRARSGEVMRGTYGFSGSESDLIARGLVPSGRLDALKARIVLLLLLMSEYSNDDIGSEFEKWWSR